jgi:hypothetical protein
VSFGGPILISNVGIEGCLAFLTVFVGDMRGLGSVSALGGRLISLFPVAKQKKGIKGSSAGEPACPVSRSRLRARFQEWSALPRSVEGATRISHSFATWLR